MSGIQHQFDEPRPLIHAHARARLRIGSSSAMVLSTAIGMWVFGLLTGAASLYAGWSSVDSSGPVSVFGVGPDEGIRVCTGLTFGGNAQRWFESGVLAGMEGALMSLSLAFLALLGLMVSLVPSRGARIVGPFMLMCWSLLWVGGALALGLRGDSGMLPIAVACVAGTLVSAVQLREGLRFSV